MRKICIALVFFGMALIFTSAAVAQERMPRKERKVWKKRLKVLSPESYKALLEENNTMKELMKNLKKEVMLSADHIKAKDTQIADYQEQISGLKRQLAEAKKATNNTTKVAENPYSVAMENKGVLFKVQIGAFKKLDLSKFSQNNPAFEMDTRDGLMTYTIGTFRDYWEADTFKKYLRAMGVKGAWIVSFKNGKRVPIKDVLEGGSI